MADKTADVKEPAEDKATPDPVLDVLSDSDKDTDQPAPSTDKEEKKPEAKETKEPEAKPVEAKAKETKESKETETESKPEPKAEKPEEKEAEETETAKPTKGEQRKEQLNTEIRDLVSRRNSLREEVQRANAEVYQPQSETDLLDVENPETGENFSRVEAKIEAMRQAQELKDYNNEVAEKQLIIESESQRVLNDFPEFNPDSEQFDEERANEAAELLDQSLIRDPNTNQVIGSNISPYQLYKTLARATQSSTVKGKIAGQKSVEKMMANADSAAGTSPAKGKKDPILEVLGSDD